MVNKVILIGNLGADPEARTTQAGTMVGNLRIATTTRRKDASGEWVDQTEWHSVVCFGRTAENVSRFLRKGRQVYIEGRLQTRKWQDREGRDRWTTEVVANEVRFLGGREQGEEGSTTPSGTGYANGGVRVDQGDSGGDGGHTPSGPDDDIPF